MMREVKPGRTFLLCFLTCFLIAAAALIYPIYVIRPFRHQAPRELMIALAVLRYRPLVMILCAISSIAALVWYWSHENRTSRRVTSMVSVIAVAAVSVLSR